MYDIIGDIHGYADELELLLARLGYQRIDGIWQHSQRLLISVGDLIDRGPQQKRSVDIIRTMVDNGFAKAIMGNHEFNAVAYATFDAEGKPLRAHTAKNRQQHLAFLREAEQQPQWYNDTIGWFSQLPLLLNLPDFRVVHACWHPASVHILNNYCTEDFRLHPSNWQAACAPEHPLYQAIEIVMKGWELALPEGVYFHDKDGHQRGNIRTRWWLEQHGNYRTLAIGVPDASALPDMAVPQDLMPGYDNVKPLFIGHYWLHGNPELLTEHIACVDYSVAAQGMLAAYRFNSELSASDFLIVPVRPTGHFSAEKINTALYLSDPMHTCCVENDCFDEYQNIAQHARELLAAGVALYDAIEQALIAAFDAEWVESHHVVSVLQQLASE